MKSILFNIVLYTIILSGIYTQEFTKVEYIGNLALALSWILILSGLIALLVPVSHLYKNKCSMLEKMVVRTLFLSSCIFMIMVGWIVTGISLLIVALLLYSKKNIFDINISEKGGK